MIRLDLAAARRALATLGAAPEDDETTARRFASGVWSCLVEPGDGVAGAFATALGAYPALRRIGEPDAAERVAAAAGCGRADAAAALARWRPRMDDALVSAAFATAGRVGAVLLAPGDDDWPDRIDDLGPHTPLALWVRGDRAAVGAPGPAVALVGARAATEYGNYVAVELAAELAGRGVTVVSGAAYGIDGAAHRATLTAGGRTVAVLAGGVDRPYPVGHTDLLGRIVQAGAVVSEAPCGSAPTKWRFLQRNRAIAALADATVVIEAGWRSGSLNTAGHAASLGRPLGAVPGPITSAASVGCHRVLREYDGRCITSADDVLELLGMSGARGPSAADAAGRIDDTTRVRDALSTRVSRTADVIAARAGMSPDDVEALLGLLLLDDAVLRSADGWRLAT